MKNCPVCKSDKILDIFKYDNFPLFNLHYYNTRQDALSAPSANVNFVKCQNCEFLFNSSYQQLDYKVEYESSRAFSKVFNTISHKIIQMHAISSGFAVFLQLEFQNPIQAFPRFP